MAAMQMLRNAWRALVRRGRGRGVGTEDPNIVGDPGPVDIPPGRDPETGGGLFASDDSDDRER